MLIESQAQRDFRDEIEVKAIWNNSPGINVKTSSADPSHEIRRQGAKGIFGVFWRGETDIQKITIFQYQLGSSTDHQKPTIRSRL